MSMFDITAIAAATASSWPKGVTGLIYRTGTGMAGRGTCRKSCTPKSPTGPLQTVSVKRNACNAQIPSALGIWKNPLAMLGGGC